MKLIKILQNRRFPVLLAGQQTYSLGGSHRMACFGESHTERDVSYNNTDDASLNRTDSMIKVADREKSDFLKKYRGIVSIDQSFF